jgi:UDP-N-acetyl-2-amino-2-deoxyglucuronate dehydrogenase
LRTDFAIIGYGQIGKRHAAILSQNKETNLVALIDSDATVKDRKDYPEGTAFFTSLKACIEGGIQPEVVCICTPNALHVPLGMEALNSNCHVLIEKPMGLTKSECEDLIRRSHQVSRHVFVVKQNRYSPPIQWLRQITLEKKLGDIQMVQMNCYWNRDDRYYSSDSWKGTIKMDGGPLYTQFSHFIDIMHWLFGDIRGIQAKFDNFKHKKNTEFEDSGMLNFNFINGGIGSLNYSTAVWDKNMESSILITGSKGSVKIGGQYMDQLEYCHIENYKQPELTATNPPNDYGGFKGSAANHAYVFDNVLKSIHSNGEITTNAMEAMMVVDIIERIYKLRRLA